LRVNRYVNFKPKGPLCPLCGDAEAADLWVGGYAPPGEVEVFCSSCIRDGVYGDTKLIAHLEANPDIDEAFKGPIILAARADVHRLRKILGPEQTDQRRRRAATSGNGFTCADSRRYASFLD